MSLCWSYLVLLVTEPKDASPMGVFWWLDVLIEYNETMNNDILAKPCCKKCGLLCQVEPGQNPPKPCGCHKPCTCKRKKPCCDKGLMKVVIPASLGDDITGQDKPSNGAYHDAIVTYEANGDQYIYDKNGAFTKVAGGGVSESVEFNDVLNRPKYADVEMTSETDIPDVEAAVATEKAERESSEAVLQGQIGTLSSEKLANSVVFWGQTADNGTVDGDMTFRYDSTDNYGHLSVGSGNNGYASVRLGVGTPGSNTSYFESTATQNDVRVAGDLVVRWFRTTMNMFNHRITSLGAPSDAQDAATKNYVDTAIGNSNSWAAIGTGSSYTKRALQVTLNISETNLTIPGDTWTSLGITLPANFRPTITMLGSVTANNNGTFEAGLVRVNADGTVEVHTSGATTDVYGSITFPVSV